MKIDGPYKAVDVTELRSRLGSQCSPMTGKSYVIGPDVNGHICHVATCHSMVEAKQHAKEANERHRKQQEKAA
jgi:hypothetical protein